MKIITKLMLVSLASLLVTSCTTPGGSFPSSTSQEKTYEIEWKLDNDTVLEVDVVKEGIVPVYNGATPSKTPSNNNVYVFEGWEPEVVAATQDTAYIAKFKEVLNSYTVTWMSDGEVIELDENIEYGAMPSFDSDTPKKESTIEKMYYFDGWDKQITLVESDVVYTAKFREVDNIWEHYPSTQQGVKTRGSKEYWVLSTDSSTILFEEPKNCTITEKEAPDAETIATWADNDTRLIQPLFDGTYVTLGSYPTNKISDETLIASLTSELETTAPTAAGDNWKAYTHWFSYDSSKSKAVAKTDALYQDIVYEGAMYRAVYFNSELPKNCSQAYSDSNQYQQTNGYSKQNLYFFDYQPIRWNIVEETEDYFTLVSLKVLDGVCFTHDGSAGYVGTYCDIRLFTEGNFYNWAFDESEKQYFVDVLFKNDKASGNNADSVDLTKKVAIPSKTEIETYFPTADLRKKTTTDYAKLNGVQVNTAGQAYWWTRSRAASNPYRVGHGGGFDSLAIGYFSSAGIAPQIYLSK